MCVCVRACTGGGASGQVLSSQMLYLWLLRGPRGVWGSHLHPAGSPANKQLSSWLVTALLKGRGAADAVGTTNGLVCEVTPASACSVCQNIPRSFHLTCFSPDAPTLKADFTLKIFRLKPTKDVEHAPAVATKCCEKLHG